MSTIPVLVVCLLAGVLLRRTGRLTEGGHVPLNVFVIHVALPALTLVQLHATTLDVGLLCPVTMPWLMFGLGFMFFLLVSRCFKLKRETTGALILCGGLANTSFVGLPMIEAFYGAAEVPIGVLTDQLGTYLTLSTLGTLAAAAYSDGGQARSLTSTMRRLCTFPPFVAMVVSFALMPVPFPGWLTDGLRTLAATVVPLALCSVGMQLSPGECKAVAKPLALGLAFKLVFAPAVLLVIFTGLIGPGGNAVRVGLFETAMGPQIGAAIVAMEYGLDRPLVASMVGLGIPLSFITLPAWYWVLSWVVA